MLLSVFLLCSVEQLILVNMQPSAVLSGLITEQNRVFLQLNHGIYSYSLSTTCPSQFRKILENYAM